MFNSILNGLLGSALNYKQVRGYGRLARELALQNRFGPIVNIHELSDEQLRQAEANASSVDNLPRSKL